MATIRTSIQIQDRLSQPMRAMHNAVSMMVNQMEAMHSASGNMMNTSSIELARRELSRAAESMNRIEQEVQGAATAQQRFTNNIRDGTSALGELLGKILAVVGAYLSLRSIQDVVRLSDEMSNIDARLNLVIESMPKIDDVSANLNINTSGLTEVEQLQKQIFDAAQRSFAPYAQTANLVGKIGMNAKDAFNNTSEVVVFAELLNKQFGIAGTNAEGVSSATLQLTQALGSGVLRGEELNSVFEAAPNIIHTIAEYLDEPIGRIREMAADGKLTADVVKNAMFSAADGINEKFNSMPLTFQ
ncbi:MAG: tape measure protein, partial [Lysinibacillus sp.]